jgi:alpha-D-ribose 1-methylphosphonate 5-triphosphate synthase subunit PhnH
MAAHGQWLSGTDVAVQWAMLRSGSKAVNAEQAAFAFFCDGGNGELCGQLSVGTLLEPELSATAIYCVEQLASGEDVTDMRGDGITLELRGPGIRELSVANVIGLKESDIEAILLSRQRYPLGLDVYLVDSTGRCIGLPRTTKIHILSEDKSYLEK